MSKPKNVIICHKCNKNWSFPSVDAMMDFAKAHHQYTKHHIEIIRHEKEVSHTVNELRNPKDADGRVSQDSSMATSAIESL